MSLADEGMTKVFYLDGKQISKETFLGKAAEAMQSLNTLVLTREKSIININLSEP